MVTFLTAGCGTAAVPRSSPASTLSPVASVTTLPTPARVIASPSPLPPLLTPTLCAQPAGTTETIAVVTTSLKEPLQARIHLPPCYSSTSSRRYPVLYLLHGQGFTADQWERLGMFPAADRLAGAGQPFIVVLPEEPDTSANPYESGFGTAVAKALLPQVDSAYRTCPTRACRAIGGLSRGAAWALLIGMQSWGQFSVIGLHSLPPFFGMQRDLPGQLGSIPPGQLPRIYLDIGFSDPYRAAAASIEAQLTAASVPHEWYLNTGDHNEAYWTAHTTDYAAWYARQLNQPGP